MDELIRLEGLRLEEIQVELEVDALLGAGVAVVDEGASGGVPESRTVASALADAFG